MRPWRTRGVLATALASTVLLAAGLAQAAWIDLGGPEPVSVRLLEDDGSRSVIEITVGGIEATPVAIEGAIYNQISLPGEAPAKEVGLPQLPNVRRSLVIPDDREMQVRVLASEYTDLPDLPPVPSKGYLPRTVDPATVPYTFADLYRDGGTYPAAVAETGAPYILRDWRGLVVDANVVQYLAATRTLRVYTRLVLELAPVGPGRVNVLQRSGPAATVDPQFATLYRDHFLNASAGTRYDPVLEEGSLLIVAYDAFAPYVEPLVQWKNQKGIRTRLVTLAETGPTYQQIFSYIQNEYQTTDLAYVLLVGDGEQVPRHQPDSDPGYALLAGGDSYPEIFVGRFSAETPEHVQTQVARTIAYERDTPAGTGSEWLQMGLGVASDQGPGHFGEYDDEHMNLIRDDLLGYGYLAVDQIYDPYGTAAQVAAALNEGRGIVSYCGHGSQTSWGSTGFSNTSVNQLVNDGLLPFICSVACNNGTFTPGTCFGEAWLRATNGTEPTGAIATYMSYISQSWDPPMYAEDEAIDLLIADQKRTVGGLWFNGSCLMMDLTGATGAQEFRNWTIFGDPSVAVRTRTTETMAVAHQGVLLIGMDTFTVDVAGTPGARCALYADGVLYGAATTDATGHAAIVMAEPPATPMTLTLTVTAYNMATVQQEIPVLPPEGPYLILDGVTVDDPLGDQDGALDYGEQAGLVIALENVGVEDAQAITATLTTEDPYLSVTGGGALSFPDIPAGTSAPCDGPCPVEVAGDVPDGHVVQLALHITSAGGIWDATFGVTVQAPVLTVAGVAIDDGSGGDGDGMADAGETVDLTVSLVNTGHSDASDLMATLASLDPNVQILASGARGPAVPVNDTVDLVPFTVLVSEDCPEPSFVAFQIGVEDLVGYATELAAEMSVGGWYDDCETDREWTLGVPGDDASTGQWLRADPVGTDYNGEPVQPEDDHTPEPGVACFVTGNGSVGGGAGDADVDGGRTTLLSPVFQLQGATTAEVSYWRWYSNDSGNNPGEDWWTVEVTADGVTWVELEHTQASLTQWTMMAFELSEFIPLTDQVQLRFVAADEGAGGSLVEAAVDDFLLDAAFEVVAVEGDALPQRLALDANYPNPFNPKTTIRFDLPQAGDVDLSVYDITGRRVATLHRGELPAGRHELSWLGRDQAGRQVASGLYVYRLETGGEILTRKMTLLK